jgi:cell division protein FtsZ
MFTYVDNEKSAKIKVIGVGGAGGNAINNMIMSKLQGVKFITANTDAQSLEISNSPVKIQLGETLTEGLGAGANPEIGREAAIESKDAIINALEGSHMVFITAGFGGGTGTGAAPVIAEICKDIGALTVAVVTKPFSFEGKKRAKQAEEGIEALKQVVDTAITIPNDRLRGVASKNATMIEMFRKADEILLHSVKGITDLIMMPGLVNLDFADVKTTMSKAGMAIMGIGIASGDNRATMAAERAISHPLLEDISISGAKGVLMNITSTSDLTMEEMTEASDRIYNEVGEDADIIWGAVVEDSLGDEMRVTVIATGIGAEPELPQNHIELARKGKVRDITPSDLKNAQNLDVPTFIRRQEAVGESGGATYRGHKGIIIDNNDLDVPTFLRRKAD